VFRDGVEGFDLGGSSAQSVILMLIVVALTVLQFRYVERRVQYRYPPRACASGSPPRRPVRSALALTGIR
jgi:hypothetical protein